MRVVVTGGRDFTDQQFVDDTLDHVHHKTPITLLIQGDARGVDLLCKDWAVRRGIPTQDCPADWVTHKKAAGFIRNQEMIDLHKPELGIVFPGGRGTADMSNRLKKAGIRRYIPPYETLLDKGTLFVDRYDSIFSNGHQAIVNTVNTKGVMGAGIAKAIKSRYPTVYDAYRTVCMQNEMQIGKVLAVRAPDGVWILNLPTKIHWGNPSKKIWIEQGLKDLAVMIKKLELHDIGMPFPGCGHGKQMRYDIRPLLYAYLGNLPKTKITLYS